jgi:peptidoglycan-N-acetylglucosamine deacetylase
VSRRLGGALLAGLAGGLTVHAAPSLVARDPLRRLTPRLAGRGAAGGVALTFDDGPDPLGTPAVLAQLRELGWTATFFLLGSQVRRFPDVAREVVAAGHEVALHGDEHCNHLFRPAGWVRRDLTRGAAAVEEATGVRPRWYRPPYGVLSGGTLRATAGLGLTPVLWTAWGRDWLPSTGERVAATVQADLAPGGTVLLHDSDCTSTPGSWRATVAALPHLAEELDRRALTVRPVGEHLRSTG